MTAGCTCRPAERQRLAPVGGALRRRSLPPPAAPQVRCARRCRRRRSGLAPELMAVFVQVFLWREFVKERATGDFPGLHVWNRRLRQGFGGGGRCNGHGHEHGARSPRSISRCAANHKQCVKCGKLVSRAAFVCRRCGKRQRIRPRTMLLVLSGCLVAAMFAVAGASALLTRIRDPPEAAPGVAEDGAPRRRCPRAIRPGDRAELWAAYARDAAQADRLLQGPLGRGERDRAFASSGTSRAAWSRGCRRAILRDGQREARDARRPDHGRRDQGASRSRCCAWAAAR